MTDNNEPLRPEDFEPHRVEGETKTTKAGFSQILQEQPFIRLLLLALPVVAIVVLVLGVFGHNKNATTQAPSQITASPSNVTQTGSGPVTKAYQDAVNQMNAEQNQQAKDTGASAIPRETASITSPIKPTDDITQFEPPSNQAPITPAAPQQFAAPAPPVAAPPVKVDPQQLQAMTDALRAMMNEVQVKTPTIIQGRGEPPQPAQAQPQQVSTGGEEKPVGRILVHAGTVLYGQTLTLADSDVPAPILATILTGPFVNCRAIGSFQKTDDYLVLAFGNIIKGDLEYQVNALAIDPDTTLDALETDIDHHYFERFVLPAAAGFISGIGNYAQQAGSTVTNSTYGITQSYPPLSTHQEILSGLGQSANAIASVVQQESNVQPTIYVESGTAFGLLFTTTVREQFNDR
jgi:type IV secretory pathway VirB10-like protein